MPLYPILSICTGTLTLFPLFFYFRPKIEGVLYFRLGRSETKRRLEMHPRPMRYLYPGFAKHINPVWRLMNLLLPLCALSGILLGGLGLLFSRNTFGLIGLLPAADLLALSACLMLEDTLFVTLSAHKLIEIEKFSCTLFFIVPAFILCLRYFP